MADEVKRLHYFTGQFLREPDFSLEQRYHLQHQRDHQRLQHTPGIALGLEVPDPPAASTSVTVQEGVAFDELGRRIVLASNTQVSFDGLGPDGAAFVLIEYDEVESDAVDETGVQGNTRCREKPKLWASATAPAHPALQLVLARVVRSAGTVASVDRSGRAHSGVKGGDLSVTRLQLASDSVAQAGWVNLSLGQSGRADLSGGLRVTGNVDVTGKVDGRDVSNDGQTLDQHLLNQANPHLTTALQIDGAGGLNRIVAAINGGTGVITEPRIDAAIARQAAVDAKFNVTTGHDHDGVDSCKIGAIDSAHFANLSGANLTALNGSQVTTGTIAEARIDPALARQAALDAKFNATSGHDHDGVDSCKIGAIDGAHFANLSGASLTGLNGSQITTGTVAEARIDPALARQTALDAKFNPTNGHHHDGVDSRKLTAYDVGALPSTGGNIDGTLTVSSTLTGRGQSNFPGARFGNPASSAHAATIYNPAGHDVALIVSCDNLSGYIAPDPNLWGKTALVILPGSSGQRGLLVAASQSGDTVNIGGTARFTGTKIGYVADTFINGGTEALHTGDIVKLKVGGAIQFQGDNNRIPVTEVVLADTDDDPLVIGIVGSEATPAPEEPDERTDPEDPNSIPPRGKLFVVTLGTFAHCKVDATKEPIQVGDLLTSSSNRGHAKKASNPKVGAVIGKALQPLSGKTGYVAIFANIQ